MEGHEYETKFPLEIERKGFEEFKELIKENWAKDIDRYKWFKEKDEKIGLYINDNKVQLVYPLHKCDKILEGLFHNIYRELIGTDPILHSIYLFDSVAPEDLTTRKWISNMLPLSDHAVDPYYGIDLLKGSKLDKIDGKCLSGVPMNDLLIGKIIDNLLWDFHHYRYIDAVKEAGAKESVEELRKTRIYKSEKGTVWDYSPLIKQEFSEKGITIEVFTKEDFERAKKGKTFFSQEIDDIICAYIHEAYADPRENIYFGDNPDSGFKYTVRYGSREETIPLQLLPKYQKLIDSRKTMYPLTRLTTRKDIPSIKEEYFKEDEIQTARIGLLKGARTWNEEKGPATNWLSKYIEFELSHAAEKLSTEMMKKERLDQEKFEQGEEYDPDRFQKKILMEDMESSGGRLDNPIETDDAEAEEADETYKDLLEKEDPLKIEDKIVLLEILKTQPRMQNIFKKQARGETLTYNERQIYCRTKRGFEKKYRKN